ncbi:hypothetical protein CHU98_g8014, partial [Xylaria longipes]
MWSLLNSAFTGLTPGLEIYSPNPAREESEGSIQGVPRVFTFYYQGIRPASSSTPGSVVHNHGANYNASHPTTGYPAPRPPRRYGNDIHGVSSRGRLKRRGSRRDRRRGVHGVSTPKYDRGPEIAAPRPVAPLRRRPPHPAGRRSARKTNYDYTKGSLDELVDVIIEGGAKLFVSAVGVPPKRVVDRLHAKGVLYMNMVGHPKHVRKACEVGADLICAQGGEAGGHTGDIPFSVLVP